MQSNVWISQLVALAIDKSKSHSLFEPIEYTTHPSFCIAASTPHNHLCPSALDPYFFKPLLQLALGPNSSQRRLNVGSMAGTLRFPGRTPLLPSQQVLRFEDSHGRREVPLILSRGTGGQLSRAGFRPRNSPNPISGLKNFLRGFRPFLRAGIKFGVGIFLL